MEHFVTYFDSSFLPQGLALNASLARHVGRYTLWVVCVDEDAYRLLSRIGDPNIRLIRLSDVENDDLKRVKPGRTRAEYCWTLTPFTPRWVFDADPTVTRVTYVDADLWLLQPPAPIFAELTAAGKSVLITDHAYAPEYDQSAESGRYCVQFVTFVRDAGGEAVRAWWEEKCIEWCFNRCEEGRFGDQKYLDQWPERFAEHVHVLKDEGVMLAPWNLVRFPYGRGIVHHFHGLRLLDGGRAVLTERYRIPEPALRFVFLPYLNDLAVAVRRLQSLGHPISPQLRPDFKRYVRVAAGMLFRRWHHLAIFKLDAGLARER